MKKTLLALCALALSACSRVSVQDYHEAQPKLDLAQYFNGKITGWGMVQDRSGKVLRRFTVHIDAHWRGDRYEGTAGDVVGVAAGEAAGNALQWRYVLALPVDGKVWHVNMDDWMYLIDEQTLANRTRMSKFGVEVAEISIFFRRADGGAP